MAVELAKAFSDDSEIPKTKKKDTAIEKNFAEKVKAWHLTLENIFKHFDGYQTSRLLQSKPIVEDNIKGVTECADFILFYDYLEKRRDTDNCSDEELGCLSMLLMAFQSKIERKLAPKKEKKPVQLKNKEAQKLMEKRKVSIDGVELNLWHGHSFDSISVQEGWNKVKSFTEMNQKTNGENGSLVFTGVMQITRQEAENYAVNLGFKVHGDVSRNTNYVVVGSENVSPTKITKVNKLKAKGVAIRIISEVEFLEMVSEYI